MAHFKVEHGEVIVSPNVIPMADIMLVLLIIFMVVTPLIHNDGQVELAKVDNPSPMPDADRDDAVIVAISRDGSTFLGRTKTPPEEISSRVRDLISGRLDKTVFLKSDARTRYRDVISVLDKIRSANVENVALLTEKSDASRRIAKVPSPHD